MNALLQSMFVQGIFKFLKYFWFKCTYPWLYRDAKIEGEWISNFVYIQERQKELWKFKQVGSLINGTSFVLEGADQGKTYSLEGEFRNSILTATYTAKEPSAIDRGTINLMLIDNGQKLSGYETFYHDPEHNIKSTECDLIRK